MLKYLDSLYTQLTRLVEKNRVWRILLLAGTALRIWQSVYQFRSLLTGLYNIVWKRQSYLQILSLKYGANNWAVVTGGATGIGRAFSNELARAGFNICIISEQEQANKEAALTIQKLFSVQTRALTVDLSQAVRQEDFLQREVVEKISDLQISILVNNAGVPQDKIVALHEFPRDKTLAILAVNACVPVLLTQALLPKLLAFAALKPAQNRAGIINVSSLCADFLVPRLSIYTTTKATVKAFSKALRAEKLPLDIYCVKPSGVSTAMLGFAKVEGFMISPEQCARAALQSFAVGLQESGGHWRHEIHRRFVIPYYNRLAPL